MATPVPMWDAEARPRRNAYRYVTTNCVQVLVGNTRADMGWSRRFIAAKALSEEGFCLRIYISSYLRIFNFVLISVLQ